VSDEIQDEKKYYKDNLLTRETIGVVLGVFSLLILFVLFSRNAIFGDAGGAIASFVLGVIGFAAYPVFICLAVLSLRFIFGFKSPLVAKERVLFALIFLCAFTIAHTATVSNSSYSFESFGGYISACFNAVERTNSATALGVLGGLLTYPVIAYATFAWEYIISGLLLAVAIFATARHFYTRKNGGAKSLAERRQEKAAAKKMGKKVVIDTPRSYPVDLDFDAIRRGDESAASVPTKFKKHYRDESLFSNFENPPAEEPSPAPEQTVENKNTAPESAQSVGRADNFSDADETRYNNPYVSQNGYCYNPYANDRRAPSREDELGSTSPAPSAIDVHNMTDDEKRRLLFTSNPIDYRVNNLIYNRDSRYNNRSGNKRAAQNNSDIEDFKMQNPSDTKMYKDGSYVYKETPAQPDKTYIESYQQQTDSSDTYTPMPNIFRAPISRESAFDRGEDRVDITPPRYDDFASDNENDGDKPIEENNISSSPSSSFEDIPRESLPDFSDEPMPRSVNVPADEQTDDRSFRRDITPRESVRNENPFARENEREPFKREDEDGARSFSLDGNDGDEDNRGERRFGRLSSEPDENTRRAMREELLGGTAPERGSGYFSSSLNINEPRSRRDATRLTPTDEPSPFDSSAEQNTSAESDTPAPFDSSRRDSLDSRRDSLDARRDSLDSRRDSLDARRDSLDTRRDSLDARRDSLDARRDSLDSRRDSLDTSRRNGLHGDEPRPMAFDTDELRISSDENNIENNIENNAENADNQPSDDYGDRSRFLDDDITSPDDLIPSSGNGQTPLPPADRGHARGMGIFGRNNYSSDSSKPEDNNKSDIDSSRVSEYKREPSKPITPPRNMNAPAISNYPPKKLPAYHRPPLELFRQYNETVDVGSEEVLHNKEAIIRILAAFNIKAEISAVTKGPAFTRYDVTVPINVTSKKVASCATEIAMHLQAKDGVNIYPNLANGTNSIEVPNKKRGVVGLGPLLADKAFVGAKPEDLTFAIGRDVEGKNIYGRIAKMTHLLVAGATGSGKSVFLNTLLLSLITHYTPWQLRLILIDPKKIEFTIYNHLPHLMMDEIITEAPKVVATLNWAIDEMERRYMLFDQMTKAGKLVRNIDEYNLGVKEQNEKLPKIVIVVDELADLMSIAKKDIEDRISRLAAKSRACGIHLVLATQRPSVDVITGVIKSNLPTRFAFKVAAEVDSRTILDEQGAEKLLGYGDMLYKTAQMYSPVRVQGALVESDEVQKVVEWIKANNECYYDPSIMDNINKKMNEDSDGDGGEDDGDAPIKIEPVFINALEYVIMQKSASISMLQRKFSIGYNKAGRIIEWMESMNYISAFDGARSRSVCITMDEFIQKYRSGDNGENGGGEE